jgi:hypothetical protein
MAAIGEVLSSSITELTAQSWPIDDQDGIPGAIKPQFGSFLRVDASESGINVFAVVFNVITGPQDTLHKPTALKMTREQLKAQQPHIFALLKTEVQAATIGFAQGSKMHARLPPHPAQVHDFVYPASKAEIVQVTEDLDFLRLLSAVSAVPTDELIAAAIGEAARARNNEYGFLIRAGQALSHLIRDDYDRLSALLRKIKPDATSAR